MLPLFRLVLPAVLGIWAATAAAQAPPRGPGERTATIVNETGLTLRELYAGPAGAPADVNDRLAADTIPSGGTWRLRLGRQQGCLFDLRAVLADDSTMDRLRVDLCANTRVTFGDPGAPLREMNVVNDTDMILRSLYAAPPGARDRGADRLAANVVAPGATYRLRFGRTRECLFDVVGVFEDDSEERRDRVDICRGQRIGFGDPTVPFREAVVVNEAATTMVRLFVYPPGAASQGPDRLGTGVLEPGESLPLRFRARGCVMALRAEYDAGAETLDGVDICARRRIAFDGSRIPRPPERSVTLVNRHGAILQEAYASAADSDDWGPDRLGAGVLEIGDRQLITLPSQGCEIDLRVVFPNGGAEERRGVDVCAIPVVVVRPGWTIAVDLGGGGGGLAASTAPPAAGSSRLRNGGTAPIVALHADAPGAPRGPDRLGSAVLGLGEVLDLRPLAGQGCVVDLVAVFRDGQEAVRPGLDLCAGQEVLLP